MQFVSEASATLSRRAAGTAEDVWLKSNLYPDYYLNTFHFQVSLCLTCHVSTINLQRAADSVHVQHHAPLSQVHGDWW